MTTYAAITDLSGMTGAFAISDVGVVFGTFMEDNGSGTSVLAPAIWQNGVVSAPVPFSTLWANSYLSFTAMNSSGAYSGYADGTSGSSLVPAVWSSGTLTYLPLWGTDTSGYADDINSSGVLVGGTVGPTGHHAVLWRNGTPSLLSPLTGDVGAVALAITDAGVVYGESDAAGQLASGVAISHAVSWQNGIAIALPTVAGEASSFVDAANGSDMVVGEVYLADNLSHAALWRNGTLTVLDTPTGYQESEAFGLDGSGRVVGYAATASGNAHAILWDNGTETDLNSLLPANSGWVLQYANAINDAGQIVGEGTNNGVDASFLLTLGGGPGVVPSSAALAAIQSFAAGQLAAPLALSDNAVDIVTNLDGLQGLAAAGKLASIVLTDQDIANLTITPLQSSGDSLVLKEISSDFTITVAVSSSGSQIATAVIGLAGRGTILQMVNDDAAGFTVTPHDNGVSFTLANDALQVAASNVTAIKFADYTEIVASQTPAASGGVSSFQIAAIYSAVLDRTPDVPGLAFYERFASANPATPLLTYAEWFLQSPEYLSNSAHTYAQTLAGETQFIVDTYENLLHRDPSPDYSSGGLEVLADAA
jgi:probable HAF family extracellular repeat protein